MAKKFRFYLFCLTICLMHMHLQAQKKAIDSLYHQGIQLLQSQKPHLALKIFEQIIDEEYSRPEGHYGLGLVFKTLYPDSNLAVPHFQKAIEMGDDFKAQAYYQLGCLYRDLDLTEDAIDALERSLKINPTHKKGWYQLDTLTQINSEPPPELAFIYLPELLLRNPSNDTLGTLYLRAALWHSKQKEALRQLSRLYELGHCETWLILALVKLHLYNESYTDGLAILDSHATHLRQQSGFEQQLLLAKILFQQYKDSTGLVSYWQAIQSATDEQKARELYNDLYYLFTQDEFHQISNLPVAQLPEFYRRFWLSRDPDRSTEVNERIPEHYRRLATAYKDYRRYAGKSFNNELLYRFEHPYRLFGPEMGDEFIASLNPNILPHLRSIDDLGIIYIRHGEPDNKIFTLCFSCDQNLSIEYYRKGDRPRLIFHFIKHSGWRNWMLETIPSYFAERYELGGNYLYFSDNPYY
jgi:tetratricopeptide (TPR) repeat protein